MRGGGMTLGFAFFCHIMRSMDLIDRIVFLLVLIVRAWILFIFCLLRGAYVLWVFAAGFRRGTYSQAGGNGVGAGVCLFFFLSIERGIKNPCCLLHMIVFTSSWINRFNGLLVFFSSYDHGMSVFTSLVVARSWWVWFIHVGDLKLESRYFHTCSLFFDRGCGFRVDSCTSELLLVITPTTGIGSVVDAFCRSWWYFLLYCIWVGRVRVMVCIVSSRLSLSPFPLIRCTESSCTCIYVWQ
jgi:hypothetical protein